MDEMRREMQIKIQPNVFFLSFYVYPERLTTFTRKQTRRKLRDADRREGVWTKEQEKYDETLCNPFKHASRAAKPFQADTINKKYKKKTEKKKTAWWCGFFCTKNKTETLT